MLREGSEQRPLPNAIGTLHGVREAIVVAVLLRVAVGTPDPSQSFFRRLLAFVVESHRKQRSKVIRDGS